MTIVATLLSGVLPGASHGLAAAELVSLQRSLALQR